MSQHPSPSNNLRTHILARSANGYTIYPAKIHNPADIMTQAWIDTGNALRQAMHNTQKDLHHD